MIRDIRPTDNPEVVVAHGQLYDLDKVLDVSMNLLAVFMGTVRRTHRTHGAEIYLDDSNRWEAFTNAHEMRIRTGFTLLKADKCGFDSGHFGYKVRIGPYLITLGLLGRHGLFRKSDGTLETIDGHPAEHYDPTPEIVICARGRSMLFLDAGDAAVAHGSIAPFMRQGIELSVPGAPPAVQFLRFTHEAFGVGEGDFRIDCTDIE